MTVLADEYDMVGFDLDGVVYRGPQAVPGAAETIAELRRRGIRVGFVTNNAQRSPAAVADHLSKLGIVCTPADVVTSSQATARIMGEALPPGAEVFVLGTGALANEIAYVGLVPVSVRSPQTAAICVGFDPGLRWGDLNEGCFAVEAGAAWYATNDDLNRPVPEGLAIGMGAILAAMTVALPGRTPTMGGKPARPLLDETRRRLGGTRPLFVGDRLDTDIEGANNAGWDSLFVLSGSHTLADLAAAPARQHPTYVGDDLRALIAPPHPYQAD
ncbi:MAG: HAD-IIA family hydrolase [Propionibacteriaceae bacterium]|jgi:HAD superfamily hydrolase (TIGR01450 family)|nr:HAD-IIA family hydrolase [Propionibacteriaceae bacterium]